ncbi:HAD family hydrolase [Paenibacillus antri]|uniref:HAD family hydrolase n=1 Tax=Paenibacillus antri TaxID=2582848 RepID=A0A5R9G2A1_9BACL|nr:HAD family hydrolase [Paenibacillus antri]TLS48426.1 HAD family hydrolase [Paenibacillus antri]
MVPVRKEGARRAAAVVCFDLSGTLVAWNAAYEAALREAMGEWVGRWGDEGAAKALIEEALLHYKKSRSRGKSKSAGIRDAVAVLQTESSERTARHIAKEARRLQPRKAAFVPGAEETLRQLSGRYRLAILTNLDAATAKELWLRLKLHRFVLETDVFAAPAGMKKPEQRLFRAVAASLGTPPRHCVMVGDSYRRDVVGAVRSGWQAVWIRSSNASPASPRSALGRQLRIATSITALPRLIRPAGRTAPSDPKDA